VLLLLLLLLVSVNKRLQSARTSPICLSRSRLGARWYSGFNDSLLVVLSVATTRVVVVILLFVFVIVLVVLLLLFFAFAFAFCCHQMNIFPFDGVSAVGVVFLVWCSVYPTQLGLNYTLMTFCAHK
jgi:hypothetical protein